MRLLILGGTRFLGRHIAEFALSRVHEVTLFHRGDSGKELFAGQVERILGDRTKDLSLLERGSWDAVVDTSGYVPRVVRTSSELIVSKGLAQRYLFISSISVLKAPEPGADETWPLGTLEDPTVEEVDGETYGPLKALCEAEVLRSFPKTGLVVRPGLIVGPHDPTDRFTYWPWRMSQAGDVVVPARRSQPVQFIDVRDLADFCISALEKGLSGNYTATGPQEPYLLGELIESIRRIGNPSARLEWVDPGRLEEWGVKPWSELPLYVGPDPKGDGMMAVSVARAVSEGLVFRPLEETVRDTLEWARTRPADHAWKAGLTPERERKLLDVWWS